MDCNELRRALDEKTLYFENADRELDAIYRRWDESQRQTEAAERNFESAQRDYYQNREDQTIASRFAEAKAQFEVARGTQASVAQVMQAAKEKRDGLLGAKQNLQFEYDRNCR